MEKITKKLLTIQAVIEKIKKDGQNAFFKKPDGKASTYATLPNILAHVKPLLNEQNLLLSQPIINGEVMTVIKCSDTGEQVTSGIPLPTNLNAQQIGSAITYYRRYTLSSLLALEIDEDDDGNNASGNVGTPPAKPAQDTSDKAWLNKFTDKTQTKTTEQWDKVVSAIKSGSYGISDIEKKYKLSKTLKAELEEIIKHAQA